MLFRKHWRIFPYFGKNTALWQKSSDQILKTHPLRIYNRRFKFCFKFLLRFAY